MTSRSPLLCFSLFLAIAALVAASTNTLAQTPDAKAKGTGSISGKVTVGAKAAVGIKVAAIGNDPYSRGATQATTDSEGRYRLFGLAAAQYLITPLAPSLVPADNSANLYSPYNAGGKTVLLSAGENVEDIDLKLVRGAVITGRVTDDEGKPVVEERIQIERAEEKLTAGRQVSPRSMSPIQPNSPLLQTDDRGIYRLYGLPAGRYKISVGSSPNNGFSSAGLRGYFAQTFYGDTNDTTKATIVEVGEGSEATDIDIRLGHRGATFSIAGRVVDSETGAPIQGIRATYGRVSRDNPGSGAYLTGLPTNPRGEFRFDGLEPGQYNLFASSRFEGGDFYGDPIIFDIVDRNVTDLELRAVRGLSISGVVVPDSDTTKTLAQIGELRILASIRSASNSPATSTTGASLVGPDGSFRIGGLRPGKASLYLSPVDYSDTRRPGLTRIEHNGQDQTLGVDIPQGQSISNVQVFISFGTGVVRGTVKFENGSPPSEARIYVGLMRNGRSVKGVASDGRGHFLITDIPPGNYEAVLNTNLGASLSPRPRPPTMLRQFVTVADDTEVEITFTVDLKPKEGGP